MNTNARRLRFWRVLLGRCRSSVRWSQSNERGSEKSHWNIAGGNWAVKTRGPYARQEKWKQSRIMAGVCAGKQWEVTLEIDTWILLTLCRNGRFSMCVNAWWVLWTRSGFPHTCGKGMSSFIYPHVVQTRYYSYNILN